MTNQETKMKICFFGDTAAFHLWRWSKYFANKEHEVHVVTFNPNITGDYGNVQVHAVRKKMPGAALLNRIMSTIPMVIDLKKLIKNINPDIIHSHSAGGYAWMPILLGFHPLIVTPWGSDVLIHVQESKIEKLFTILALKKADLITCDGENTKKAIMDLGISSQKIKFITFGVDIQKFKPGLTNKAFKEKLGLVNSKIVISTRFLTPVHNAETLIKAIPPVLEKIANVKFVIVGGGPQKEYLMDLAKALDIFNAVKFIGNVSEDEMVRYLQVADVYVSTSLSESGLAASTAEAMACELPVINTSTGDIKLWIKDGEGGFIVPTKNPEVLSEKIIYLLKNEKIRKKFGKINRKIIEERNNYYREMAKMENLYKKLIKENYES